MGGGFQDEISMKNACLHPGIFFCSDKIIVISTTENRHGNLSTWNVCVWYVAFRLADLIKSSKLSHDNIHIYGMFGGVTEATSFIYPIL